MNHDLSVKTVKVSTEGPDGSEQTLDPVGDREVGRLQQEGAHSLRRVVPHSDTIGFAWKTATTLPWLPLLFAL